MSWNGIYPGCLHLDSYSTSPQESNSIRGNGRLLVNIWVFIWLPKAIPNACHISMVVKVLDFSLATSILFTVAARSIVPPPDIKLSNSCWNLSSIAARNHYHTIKFCSPLMLSLQLGRLPDIWLPDTESVWCMTKIKPYITWKYHATLCSSGQQGYFLLLKSCQNSCKLSTSTCPQPCTHSYYLGVA